jgi:hypothetical protein
MSAREDILTGLRAALAHSKPSLALSRLPSKPSRAQTQAKIWSRALSPRYSA